MKIEILTEGLRFPEGPVWMQDGSVIVCEIAAGVLTRVAPDGRKTTVAECGGGPDGIAVGPDGMLYVCNHGGMVCFQQDGLTMPTHEPAPGYKGGWIDRIDPQTGKVDRLYEECDGRRLAAPNDIVFDCDGAMWFSDLGKHVGHTVENGGIYYAKPDGSSITRVIDGLRVNGIGISPDEKTLYTAISFESLLLGFDIKGPGILEPLSIFPGYVVSQFGPRQLVDSLAVLANGHICVGTCVNRPGIGSVDPATGVITDHEFPDRLTSNICFGGADMRDAWVTLSTSGRLAKVRWSTPGLRLAYYA